MLPEGGAHTPIMHLMGIVATIGTGIYTVAWAWSLLKSGNRAGAFWSTLLAVAATATSLWFYYQHGFFP